MTAGLFALSCPECGGELATDRLGTTGTCASVRALPTSTDSAISYPSSFTTRARTSGASCSATVN